MHHKDVNQEHSNFAKTHFLLQVKLATKDQNGLKGKLHGKK